MNPVERVIALELSRRRGQGINQMIVWFGATALTALSLVGLVSESDTHWALAVLATGPVVTLYTRRLLRTMQEIALLEDALAVPTGGEG